LRTALTADDSVDANIESISHCHWALANIHMAARRTADADRHFREALRYHERLMALEPNLVEHHAALGAYLGDFANLLVGVGRLDEAEAVARRAVASTTAVIGQDARNLHCRRNLLVHYDTLVRIAEARNHPAQRLDAFQRRAATLEEIVADFPREPEFVGRLHGGWYNVGFCLVQMNRHAEALTWFEKVPEGSGLYPRAAHGRVWVRLTAPDRSLRNPAEAVRLCTPFAAQESAPDLGSWLMLLGWAQHRAGDSKTALSTLERALKTPGGDTDVWLIHAMVTHKLGDPDEARRQFAACAKVMDERPDLGTNAQLVTIRAEAARELGLTDAGAPKPAGKANDGN
jgi:tetratricopeptide (TPR) repeat protein